MKEIPPETNPPPEFTRFYGSRADVVLEMGVCSRPAAAMKPGAIALRLDYAISRCDSFPTLELFHHVATHSGRLLAVGIGYAC